MSKTTSEIKEAWTIIILFLMLLIALSSIAYYAILKLNPTSIYVGVLMISPALAAFIPLKIKKRPISILPCRLKELKYLKLSYITPIVYVSIANPLI